jgi:putative exporter of polyketide antibiotics
MQSTFLNLNTNDFIKGLIMAVLSTVITIVYQTVQAGSLVFDWKSIGTMALTTALAYIMKNLFTNSTGTLFAAEQK